MNKSHLFGAVCICLLISTTTPTVASVVYSYSGNNFNVFSTPTSYDNTMSVTGTVELAAALGNNLVNQSVTPLSFSFSDGVGTLTDANAVLPLFLFSTDAAGAITSWQVGLADMSPLPTGFGASTHQIFSTASASSGIDRGRVVTCNAMPCAIESDYIFDFGQVLNNAGTWSVVPVPTAAWLFGSGLLGLIGMSRRKKAS